MVADHGYLEVRCGGHRILLPGEGIVGIGLDVTPHLVHLPLPRARRLGFPLVIDLRIVLGLTPAAAPGTTVEWQSPPDGDSTIVLAVDAAERLHSDVEARFLPLPRVPPVFHALFDALMIDDGRILMRLRRDIDMRGRDSRRRLCQAVLGAMPPAQQHWVFEETFA
jgi:hypothetical protein